MWNGFYKLDSIIDINTLKELFREALSLSGKAYVHIKRSNRFSRELYIEMSPEEYIETKLSLDTHNVFINRWAYRDRNSWAPKEGEIGSCTLGGDNLFLFIFVSLENLEMLSEKYKLDKQEF